MQKSTIARDSQESQKQEFHEHRKNTHRKLLNGNEQSTDVLNELVTHHECEWMMHRQIE